MLTGRRLEAASKLHNYSSESIAPKYLKNRFFVGEHDVEINRNLNLEVLISMNAYLCIYIATLIARCSGNAEYCHFDSAM